MKFKKTMAKTLVFTFFLIIIIISIMAHFTFRYITGYIASELPEKTEMSELDETTVEHKLENVFGVIGTRMIFLVGSSIIVGIVILAVTGKWIIKPIKNISNAAKRVSKGEFDIELKKVRNDEIGELTENFNKMTKALGRLEYLQKDFISNVSHEFKSPIFVIQGYIKLLEDDNLSKEERQKYLKIIKEETDKLSLLSANSLRLSKLENQEKQMNKEKFSLDEQIRKCVLSLEPKWRSKNIEFDIKLKNTEICAEKELLEQVWINLIENAIKFSNENGKIFIKLKTQEQNVIISIKDEGIGIKKEKLERIFEKFYQADQAHSGEGSGLGLTIVNRIIILCNGNIDVKSELGKGTEFIITLPIK